MNPITRNFEILSLEIPDYANEPRFVNVTARWINAEGDDGISEEPFTIEGIAINIEATNDYAAQVRADVEAHLQGQANS